MLLGRLDQLLPDQGANLVFSGVLRGVLLGGLRVVEPVELVAVALQHLPFFVTLHVLHVELQVVARREAVDLLALLVQALEFTGDVQVAAGVALVERDDAHGVPGDDHVARLPVEEAEREHASQVLEELPPALLLVEVDDGVAV